jgi:hypothetical protein
MLGGKGKHVAKIQGVVIVLDGATIVDSEIDSEFYGPSTAAAVLAYKRRRRIINASYQTQADDIVGKMTIKALDDELMSRQVSPASAGSGTGECTVEAPPTPTLAQLRLNRATNRRPA